MATADEYHQYARECLETAAKATTENQRKQFMDMAHAWTLAALRLEGLVPGPEHGRGQDGQLGRQH
jgi:hypothetical protein